jgi:hypothetical protein
VARGGSRVGAGPRPLPVLEHLRNGTFRASRHAHRLAELVAPTGVVWTPSEADKAALGPAGRRLLDEVLDANTLTITDGHQLLEAARAADTLLRLRMEAEPNLTMVRLWSQHLCATLRALGLSRS